MPQPIRHAVSGASASVRDASKTPQPAARILITIVAVLAAMAAGALTFATSSTAQGPAPTVFISTEASAPSTSSTCPGQSRTSPAGIALRMQVSAQDDGWRAAAASAGATGFVVLDMPTSTDPNRVDTHPTDIAVPGTALTVSVSKRDVTPAERDSLAPLSNGTLATAAFRDPYAPAWGTSAGASTLQDCAPRPTELYVDGPTPQPRMWNAIAGSGSSLDAAFFEFSTPVEGFGAWFGDLETRSDGDGTAAFIKLFDAAGAVIYAGPVPSSTPDQTICGGTSGVDGLGCGNQATRWIGFFEAGAAVKSMLVVVGDDDSCVPTPSNCTGFAENLSWVGATVVLPPDPTPTPTPTPIPTSTPVPSSTPTTLPTATTQPTATTMATPTSTATTMPTVMPTLAPTTTPDPTATPMPTATTQPTTTSQPTATPMPTATTQPTATPMPTATTQPTATPEPTATPMPTAVATVAPTSTPVPVATARPTSTALPTPVPTSSPAPAQTTTPTPTTAPTSTPTPTPEPVAGVDQSDGFRADPLPDGFFTPTPTPQDQAVPDIGAPSPTGRALAFTGSGRTRSLTSAALLVLGVGSFTVGALRRQAANRDEVEEG